MNGAEKYLGEPYEDQEDGDFAPDSRRKGAEPKRGFSFRFPDNDEDPFTDVIRKVVGKFEDHGAVTEAKLRERFNEILSERPLDEEPEYLTFGPDPTGRTSHIAKVFKDRLEADLTRVAEEFVAGRFAPK